MAEWYRNIKRYMSGEDVTAVKQRLLELGYLASANKPRYGDDSYKACKAFQSANGLERDGIIGIRTWSALFADHPAPSVPVPEWISEPYRTQISQALATVSVVRRDICLEALRWCVDSNSNPDILRGFYIRGANLYDKDLTLHIMTELRLDQYFRKSQYEPYFDNGREEMMRRMAKESGYSIVGADCSGMIVGLWRNAKVVSSGFDSTADNLYGSYCTKVASPKPGDLAHKSGHIGICVCDNPLLFVASEGGAYGFQHSGKDRKVMDFRTGKTIKLTKWQHYGDPKCY